MLPADMAEDEIANVRAGLVEDIATQRRFIDKSPDDVDIVEIVHRLLPSRQARTIADPLPDIVLAADDSNRGMAPWLSRATRAQVERALRRYQDLLREHRQKLRDYKANPSAHDNKGYYRDAPSPEVREKIYNSRVRHLETEIRNFEQQIKLLESVLQQK